MPTAGLAGAVIAVPAIILMMVALLAKVSPQQLQER